MALNFIAPRDNNNIAIARPLDAFVTMDQDIANDVQYYGSVDHNGAWVIQQIVNSAGTFRYAHGPANYTTAWGIRDSLAYDLWNGV